MDGTSVLRGCVRQVVVDKVDTLKVCCLALGVSRKETYEDIP